MLKKVDDSSSEEYATDEYTKTIGEIGIWQMGLFLILAVPIKLVLPAIQLGIVYMAPKTSFQCISRPNSTEEMLNNTCYNDCEKYQYFSIFDNSIISEWDLICDRDWIANFSQSLAMSGIIVGNVVFSFIGDRYGRRICLIIAGILETCFSFLLPFSPNLGTFLVTRLCLGIVSAGTMMTSFVFLIEIFGARKRELMNTLYMIPICFGYVLMTLVAYYLRDWRKFCLCAAVPTLVYLTYFFILPDSPKWLITVKKLDNATKVMESAAKWNKLPTGNVRDAVHRISNKSLSDQQKETKANFFDLIRLKSLRLRTICSFLVWFAVGVCMYGSSQYFGQTFPNPFLSVSVSGIIQFPCIIAGGFITKFYGRRGTIIGFLLVGAVCSALLVLSDDWYYIKLVAGSLGVCFPGTVFSLIYLYTPELFPTVARNMAFGTSSVGNRIGSALAPFVGSLQQIAPWLPPVVFAITPIIGIVACYLLPETKGKELDDYIET